MNKVLLNYQSIESDFLKKYNNLYQCAVLHIAWRIDKKQNKPYRRLVVAWLEFFPIECTCTYELPECHKDAFYYMKLKMNLKDAFRWYIDVLKNKYITMTWQNNEKIFFNNQDIQDVVLHNIPVCPEVTVSECNPYIGHNWGICQNNHIFPDRIDDDILSLVRVPQNNRWLTDRMFWDINEHLEYLGSVHLLLPNPIYSKISCRLLPALNNNSNDCEEVCCKIILRKNKQMNAMEYVFLERAIGEIVNVTKLTPQNNVFKFNLSKYTEEIAYLATHNKLGLIDYQPFRFFLQSLRLNMRIGGAKRKVKLKNGEEYDKKIYTPLSEMEEKKQLHEYNFQDRLNQIRFQRSLQKSGDKLNQKIFFNEHEDATNLIREIIGKALKKVIIIDPYFGILETYSFALAVCASNIEIEIITSSDLLREIDGKSLLETTGCTPQEAKDKNIDTEEFETGNVLKKHITKIIQKDTTIKNITVNVMRGKAVFHDRFIIIDDTDVWFSGNSFNSIGKKVGAIIKLPNPSEMLEILAKIHNEPDFLLPIDTWLKKRQENKEEKNVLP